MKHSTDINILLFHSNAADMKKLHLHDLDIDLILQSKDHKLASDGGSENIPVFEYSAKKVKQAITGNGNADKTQLQYMIKQIFKLKQLPSPLDASDAIGIALCHIYQTKTNEL